MLWTEPSRASALVEAVRASGLRLSAIGGADSGSFESLKLDGDVRIFDDLRAASVAEKPKILLITAPTSSEEPALDSRTISTLRTAGTVILTSVPTVNGILEAAEIGLFRESDGVTPASSIRLAPRVRRHPSFVAAADVFETFGRVNLMTVESFATRSAGGLTASMLSAIDAVMTVIGVPELADAAAARPTKRLVDLDGSVAALLRFPDGRCGQLMVSDRGPWGWRVTLTGDSGRLTIRPSGFDWLAPDGERKDETRIDAANSGYESTLAALLKEAAMGTMADPMTDWVGLLSTAEAVLLSSRTGQPEAPDTIARAAHSSV